MLRLLVFPCHRSEELARRLDLACCPGAGFPESLVTVLSDSSAPKIITSSAIFIVDDLVRLSGSLLVCGSASAVAISRTALRRCRHVGLAGATAAAVGTRFPLRLSSGLVVDANTVPHHIARSFSTLEEIAVEAAEAGDERQPPFLTPTQVEKVLAAVAAVVSASLCDCCRPPSDPQGVASAAGRAAAAPVPQRCRTCGRTPAAAEPPFKLCSGCRAVRFCGDACRRAGWKAGHKAECRAAAAAAAAAVVAPTTTAAARPAPRSSRRQQQ